MAELVLDAVVKHRERVAGMNITLEIDVVAEGADHLGEDAGCYAGPVRRSGKACMDRAAAQNRDLTCRPGLVLDNKAAGVVARDYDVPIRRQRETKTQQPVGLGKHRRLLPRAQIT